jgi:hypothetical protein
VGYRYASTFADRPQRSAAGFPIVSRNIHLAAIWRRGNVAN